ncbi:hypothetical protein DFH09DRAFT_499401 [Mycena vulgaris]|nr:hypothetical protein DFH09DRAFT_499401 [Mycena vulgaris]
MGQGASKPVELRAKCGHFRVLVIGRANAGKTTLLKRVCDTIEDPEIYDVRGKKIDPKVIEASENRGEHDIENELIFKSNPQFIFHDSRGFESGSVKETRKMKNFIRERARTSKLADQLHAIWYCLPTNTNRPLLGAEEDFFNNFDRGTVPVIAVFTKFDGLIDETFAKLLSNGCSYEEAEEWALPQAVETLSTDLEAPLARFEFHPSDCVQMHDMRETGSDCRELIAKTANALNDDTLQMLLISVQRNNIYISVTRATGGGMIQENLRRIIIGILSYFPHFWISKDPYEEVSVSLCATRRNI